MSNMQGWLRLDLLFVIVVPSSMVQKDFLLVFDVLTPFLPLRVDS